MLHALVPQDWLDTRDSYVHKLHSGHRLPIAHVWLIVFTGGEEKTESSHRELRPSNYIGGHLILPPQGPPCYNSQQPTSGLCVVCAIWMLRGRQMHLLKSITGLQGRLPASSQQIMFNRCRECKWM